MLQALPESSRLTELRAGLARLPLQGPRAQSCSRERKISTDSRPALESHEVMGLIKQGTQPSAPSALGPVPLGTSRAICPKGGEEEAGPLL